MVRVKKEMLKDGTVRWRAFSRPLLHRCFITGPEDG
jgi:hypothetical protein